MRDSVRSSVKDDYRIALVELKYQWPSIQTTHPSKSLVIDAST